MSRAAVYDIVKTATGYDPWSSNAVDSIDERPFIILRWEEVERQFGLKGKERLSIWVHDTPGDYGRILSILDLIKAALADAVHVAGADGYTLTVADWAGRSADLYDDGYKTITKYDSYDIVARKT